MRIACACFAQDVADVLGITVIFHLIRKEVFVRMVCANHAHGIPWDGHEPFTRKRGQEGVEFFKRQHAVILPSPMNQECIPVGGTCQFLVSLNQVYGFLVPG